MVIDFEIEEDGRWIAEMKDLPGVMCYGKTPLDALSKLAEICDNEIRLLDYYQEYVESDVREFVKKMKE